MFPIVSIVKTKHIMPNCWNRLVGPAPEPWGGAAAAERLAARLRGGGLRSWVVPCTVGPHHRVGRSPLFNYGSGSVITV